MPIKKRQNTTLDSLALMIAKGFEETVKKEELLEFQKETYNELSEIKETIDRIEKIILADHRERIIRLEDQVKELQSDYRQLLGIKK